MATAKPYPDQEELKSRYAYNEGKLYNAKTGIEVMGSDAGRGYLKIKIGARNLFKHRIIWKLINGVDPDTIDHINGDKKDNRIENLRNITQSMNVRNNLPRGGKSKFKGVYVDNRTGRYGSRIKVNKKTIHLGTYDAEVDAAMAYDEAAIRLHGEYSKTNKHLGLY